VLLEDIATKLSSSSRNALSACLVIVAAIALYSWIVAPHVAHLQAVQRYEPTVDNIAHGNRAVSSSLAGKKKKLEQLREQSGQYRSMLFTPDKAAELFSDLQTIAEQSGCAVISVNFGAGGARPTARRSGVPARATVHRATLSVVGTYDHIVGLLKRLQARTQKVWVDTFTMTTFNIDLALVRSDMSITVYTTEDEEAPLNE
jgi:hypothetical protein